LLLLCACDRNEGRSVRSEAGEEAAAPGAAFSLYDLDLALTESDGAARRLAELRDTVRVAAMMYTSCRSVCPRIAADMAAVARLLPEADRRRVGFVMFSLDPGRDSPRALRNFAREHDLDPRRWRLFSAAEEDVRTLAADLGVKSRPDEGGEIAHSAMIFVIDGRGVVRHRQVGLNQDPADLIAAVRAAR
jgi:protein SCO1/2